MTNNIPLERALMQLAEIRAHVETFECMPNALRADTHEVMDLLEGRLFHYSNSQKAIDDIVAERGER